MMREAKIDTIVQVLTVPVQMYAVVSSCTRLYRYTAVRRQQNCRRVDHFRRQMDHVIKTADESITSPKFT